MKRQRAFAAILTALAVVGPAEGYKFFGSPLVPSSVEAERWQQSDFPLRFRMMDNDNAPIGVELTEEGWAEIVERSFDPWTRIPTARIELVLEDDGVAISVADEDDGINTIGFSSDEDFVDTWITAWARWRRDGDRPVGCDIEFNPDFVKNWSPQDPYHLLEIIAVHEMGHCLGLGHTQPHPMPLWTDQPVHADPSFLPDPVMSYSNSYGLNLPEDDTKAISLLYPAPGFLESHGSVRGRVVLDARPAIFAYIQAVRPGAPGVPVAPGPGTFADENGDFHLEGLSPGDWMLWVHPILIPRRNANRVTQRADEAGVSDFRDQMRWVRVNAGEALEDVEIIVHPGREVTP